MQAALSVWSNKLFSRGARSPLNKRHIETMDAKTKKTLKSLERRLDKLALAQLRETAAALQNQVEQLESELSSAQESADFWHEQATEMQLAMYDENYSTHRCIGINKAGEMMVVTSNEQPN